MIVDNTNFEKAFQTIQDKKLIQKSKLISFDLEFSGLKFSNLQSQKFYDLPQQRYLKMKQVVTNYSIIQLGLTFFIEKSQYQTVAYPFSFYLFPRQSRLSNPKISLQSGVISFLNQHGMDWNRWIQKGITYVQISQIENLRNKNPLSNDLQEMNLFGFSLLFQKIWTAHKKLIGHNILFDLMYIFESLISPLPETLNEFKAKLKDSNNIFMDTKTLCDQFMDEGFRYAKNTNLKALKQYFSKYAFPQQKINVAENFKQYDFKMQKLHDAGYESLVTGFIYIRMCNFLKKQRITKNEGLIHITRSYFTINISEQNILRNHHRVIILYCKQDTSLLIESLKRFLMKLGLGNNNFIQKYQRYIFVNAISKNPYEQMKKQIPRFVQISKSLMNLRIIRLQQYYLNEKTAMMEKLK